MSAPPSVFALPRLGWLWLAGALLGAALLLGLHAASLERTWIAPSQAPAPSGIAGRAQWGGLIPEFAAPPRIFLDNDCYYWIRYAQEMVRTGSLRLRHTDLDNVPAGRAVHWSAPFSWWLIACGSVESLVTGQPLHNAIESAALWSNPALFWLLLAMGAALLARPLGVARTGALVLLFAALPGIEWAFAYGRPGHHGLHALAAAGGILCVVLGGAGWTRTGPTAPAWLPTAEVARRWFTAGGIFGALGLWFGATQQIVVFGSVGLAAIVATLLARPRDDAAWDGTLWRRWGTTAALASLAFYALEYFPGWPRMRLEVNHPLYAAAFWAGGDLLARLAAWRAAPGTRLNWNTLAPSLLLLLAVPVALLLGPREWHALRDPAMRRLHDDIMNFQPLITAADAGMWFKIFREFALLPLVLPLAAWAWWRRRHAGPSGAVLLLALVPAAMLAAWTLYQVRWSNLVSPALAVLLIVLWREWAASPSTAVRWSGRVLPWAALVPLAGMLVLAWQTAQRQAAAGIILPHVGWSLASRDVAFNLKRLAQLGPVRVMSGPSQTPSLHFFGGVQGTGSLYWENLAGVHAAADFFADTTGETALRLVRERGITHVIVQQDPVLAEQMAWVKAGRGGVDPRQTLAWQLANPVGRPPEWLEPLPYYGSPAAARYQMRIFRVRPAALTPSR
ncbi:MAG: hypothetical protein Q8M02_14310 [Candidatus Didemnitutus sp.]|nr:hypothetical protein [Candidatus Didemnitutus sp.]